MIARIAGVTAASLVLLAGCKKAPAADPSPPAAPGPAARPAPVAAAEPTPEPRRMTPMQPDAGVVVWRAAAATATGVAPEPPDAALPAPPAPSPAVAEDAGWAPRWIPYDGGALGPGGETDVVELQVGQSIEIWLPRSVMLGVCDEPLVRVDDLHDHLGLVGLKAGSTHCGFWFSAEGGVGRNFAVTVRP